MSFNPKVFLFAGNPQNIDHTPSGAVSSGDVVVNNGVAYFSQNDIAASALGALAFSGGVWKGNKSTGAIALGDRVYWIPTGSPVTGTASTGAFTNTAASGGIFVGYATTAALSADQFVYFVKENAPGSSNASDVAAAGSVQGDATALSIGFNRVTAADATKGVILPAGAPGRTVEVKNGDAANAILKVYPPTSGTINALSANAAISMAAKTSAVFKCLDGTAWFTIPLVPS